MLVNLRIRVRNYLRHIVLLKCFFLYQTFLKPPKVTPATPAADDKRPLTIK
jgi:hypothetical protein